MTTKMSFLSTAPFVRALAITALLVGFAGCASRPYQKADATADSMAIAANEVEMARTQLTQTTTTLASLLNATAENPTTAFAEFRASLVRLDRTAEQLQVRAVAMEAQGQSYFKTWDEQLARIQNDEMRASSEARQRELSGNFTALQQSYVTARRDLTPLLSNLRDLQTMLGTDLTQTGIARAREFMPKIESEVTAARASLDGLADRFRVLSMRLKVA